MLRQFILAAQAQYLVLLWSPWIIAETHRLLTWLWIDRHFQRGGAWDAAAKRQCSQAAHAWLTHVAPAFEVVEDRPPYEPMWTASPPDEYDWPVWTAAVRGRAQIVVTDNLKDGPPPNGQGLRQWQGIGYLRPADFQIVLDIWSDQIDTGWERPTLSIAEHWDAARERAAEQPVPLSDQLTIFITQLERRFAPQQPPAAGS